MCVIAQKIRCKYSECFDELANGTTRLKASPNNPLNVQFRENLMCANWNVEPVYFPFHALITFAPIISSEAAAK